MDSKELIADLSKEVENKEGDAAWLRRLFAQGESLQNIVYLAGHLWAGKIKTHYPN